AHRALHQGLYLQRPLPSAPGTDPVRRYAGAAAGRLMARQSAPRGGEPHTPAGAPDKGLKGGCAMPEDNVFQRITQEYYQLTASEKKLANYVVANGQRTQSMSISELAGECAVAEATITR